MYYEIIFYLISQFMENKLFSKLTLENNLFPKFNNIINL